MSESEQRKELHKTIWRIANELRGAVDGWEFKSYVLGTLFYRYISESICLYINNLQHDAGYDDFDYALLTDNEAEEAREMVVEEKGYFILPSQLFCNVVNQITKRGMTTAKGGYDQTENPMDELDNMVAEGAPAGYNAMTESDAMNSSMESSTAVSSAAVNEENLNVKLNNIFRSIEASAQGRASEEDLKGLFGDFLVDNTSLGRTVVMRNRLLAKVLVAVAQMDLGSDSLDQHEIDAFGDTYEFLMQMYAANAGKSGGEYFTPPAVSRLLARLALIDNPSIRTVYDPCCGSGSLLLKFAKEVKERELNYFGQEINPSTYNLCRINMFLHGINFENFDIRLGDTLHTPWHLGEQFDAIVSNPPYSTQWEGEENPVLINDQRFAPAGVLAPKSKADLAFTMHMVHHLSERGVAAIVEFPGVLYRGGAEQKIRRYLLEQNLIDTVIQLPANLFFGVSIATCIIILRKGSKRDNAVLFVDASNEFRKEGNKNLLDDEHIDRIVEAVKRRNPEGEQYFTALVQNATLIKENSCNLSVSTYVEQMDTREAIDIEAVNRELTEEVVPEVNRLRAEVEKMILAMEG